MADPDYVYDPDNWEVTYIWSMKEELSQDLDICDIKQFSTLIDGPEKWCVIIPLDIDEAGDAGDREVLWFDSEEEAVAALAKARGEAP